MVSAGRLALLVFVALVVVGIVIWYLRRRFKKSAVSGNQETAEQRAEAYRERRDRDIPLRQRALKTPLEAKIVAVLALGVIGVVIWNVYAYMKTGSPTQIAVATETKFVSGFVVAWAVGIVYERHRQRTKEGRIDVTYEADPAAGREEQTVTYYYDPRDTEQTDDGPVVYETKKNRFFGLIRLPKLHGDDRRFNNVEDSRPPEDKVGIGIPSHARNVDDNHYAFRTKDDKVLDSPVGLADIVFLPPDNMSRQQRMQRSTDMDNLQTSVQELQARNAELEYRQRSRREEEKNELDRKMEQLNKMFREFSKMMPGMSQQIQVQEEEPVPSRSSRDGNGRREPEPPQSNGQQQRGGDRR